MFEKGFLKLIKPCSCSFSILLLPIAADIKIRLCIIIIFKKVIA